MDEIARSLRDSAAVKLEMAKTQVDVIEAMVEVLWERFERGGKVLLCGNGGSAADAQHLATELIVRLQHDRCPFPAIALTTDTSLLTAAGNDYGFEQIFARQVEGLGRPEDVLLAISTSGDSRNVILAVEEARRRGMKSLGFLGKGGGRLKTQVDVALVVPSSSTQHIQEAHITVGHILCAILENRILETTPETAEVT